MLGTVEAGELVLLGVLAVSTLLSVGYLMPIVARGFLRPPADGWDGGVAEAPLRCVVPLCATALGALVLFFVAPAIIELLEPLS